ncbi:uncharacterized protein LOC122061217 [Macadamia integrifolia]|uniref:uncharacterized protein LOC122061217 n=1 Tax=Macadamia integrifolia TaxID=60698 RepID=UPI001C530DDE|nr:uncharacterized protein LOC122061217 [Macadamia integrifolia]XP_042480359.1 uncharacterized protein LOC122061217 [Macadamia integrifolia]
MEVKVAATCLHWSQSVASHSPSLAQTIASAISSPSSKKQRGGDRALVCRFVHKLAFLGTTSSTKLLRSRSCDAPKSRRQFLRRACSANLDGYSEEEFAESIRELARRFNQTSDDDEEQNNNYHAEDVESDTSIVDSREKQGESNSRNIDGCSINSVQRSSFFQSPKLESVQPPWFHVKLEPPDWPGRNEINQANIERKANSVDLPLSLRIIKKKKQCEEGFREAGETAYCSMKKAFSSMVFIIREIHSYTLQMREILFYEDLQDILARVQKEMHASFVWLFQQVFSQTPTLMVYVMILLANFTVYSMGNNSAIAAPPPPASAAIEMVSVNENQPKNFDSSSVMKKFSVSSSGKTAFVGGHNGGGGGKFRRVMSGTEGDGPFDGSSSSWNFQSLSHHQVSSFGNPNPNPTTTEGAESAWVEAESGGVRSKEEMKLWNSIVDESIKMQSALRDEALDHGTMQRFVSPVKADIEGEEESDYSRTELLYNMAVSQEPNNPMLLANYAQFLYVVLHDHDRAEEYFKKAIGVGRKEDGGGGGGGGGDAEALSKYATFLWLGRNDITAAEEMYLEAISADPGNTYHAANYAHFLWNTGGEDTCYPIDSLDNDFDLDA